MHTLKLHYNWQKSFNDVDSFSFISRVAELAHIFCKVISTLPLIRPALSNKKNFKYVGNVALDPCPISLFCLSFYKHADNSVHAQAKDASTQSVI